MSRRLRRLPTVLLPVLLLAGLTACGSDDDASASQPLDAVSIEGEVGKEPQVTWKDQLQVDSLETKTLETGDGPEIQDGDKVNAQIWIGERLHREEGLQHLRLRHARSRSRWAATS